MIGAGVEEAQAGLESGDIAGALTGIGDIPSRAPVATTYTVIGSVLLGIHRPIIREIKGVFN